MQAVRFLALLILVTCPLIASGQQEACLQPGRLDLLRTQILNGTGPRDENNALRDELVKAAQSMSEAWRLRLSRPDDEKVRKQLNDEQVAVAKRLCAILNTGSWPTRGVVGNEGMNSFLYLIGRAMTIRQQLELYPLVAAAFEKREIEGSETLAAYVDRLRVALGRKQLYGTQVTPSEGFLVQAPIEIASEVDKRRAAMELVPLRKYERALEIANRMPLIRAVTEPVGNFTGRRLSTGSAGNADDSLGLEGEAPVIKLETAFVSIDVNIPDAADGASTALVKADFKLFDNGKPVEIDTFARAEAPFDIVLLLDLSGSTSDKLGLIKKTTRRFVEMKRPDDRVAVVTFNDTQAVVSELESNQSALLERIKKIDGKGASAVWESIKFSIDMLDARSEKGRRRAIVLMSDGADNLLGYYPRSTQAFSFADLIESVQQSNITIFPVFLDTFSEDSSRIREDSQRTLGYIADQSGGTMYTARKLDDLVDIYDRVLKGVGTVYTLGFSPEVGEVSGRTWRTIKVEVPSRPQLKLRHRPGYFTR